MTARLGKLVAENRKARFDVSVEDEVESGIVLTGDEIKSIRAGRAQITGGYVKLFSGNWVVIGLHLPLAKDADRTKALLMHKKEMNKLKVASETKGMAIIPLKLKFVRGWAKLDIGIGRGRKAYDKRELLKKRDLDRESDNDYKKTRLSK